MAHEDAIDWLEVAAYAIQKDHKLRSPDCRAPFIFEVVLPEEQTR